VAHPGLGIPTFRKWKYFSSFKEEPIFSE